MSNTVPVLKNADGQERIPTLWRRTLSDIVEAFKDQDFRLDRGVAGVRPIPVDDARRIAQNIENYGVHLTSLQEGTWQTSVCQWMRRYWGVLLDLYTVEEGASDLVLAVRIYEEGSAYVFEVQSVYVP